MTISITITGETALDVLRDMSAFRHHHRALEQAPVEVEVEPTVAPVEVEPPSAPAVDQTPAKPKRRRRTKAEIEAENLRAEAKAEPSGHDQVRALLKEIEKKHGAKGIANATVAMRETLDRQGEPFDRVKVSLVKEPLVWSLVNDMRDVLEADADE